MNDTSDSDGSREPSIWAGAATLAVLAAICTALVAFTHELTRDRIAENQQRFLEESLQPVLEGLDYEGTLSESVLTVAAPHDLPGTEDATIYRLYADQQPLAALFIVTPKNGYAGPIRLLIGVDADGEVLRVRVLEHRETPGLGNRIEAEKSDWIEIFRGKSLGSPVTDQWEIRRDGGAFDQLSGASITSRAVVQAVRDTLIYFSAHRDRVFARDAEIPNESGA